MKTRSNKIILAIGLAVLYGCHAFTAMAEDSGKTLESLQHRFGAAKQSQPSTTDSLVDAKAYIEQLQSIKKQLEPYQGSYASIRDYIAQIDSVIEGLSNSSNSVGLYKGDEKSLESYTQQISAIADQVSNIAEKNTGLKSTSLDLHRAAKGFSRSSGTRFAGKNSGSFCTTLSNGKQMCVPAENQTALANFTDPSQQSQNSSASDEASAAADPLASLRLQTYKTYHESDATEYVMRYEPKDDSEEGLQGNSNFILADSDNSELNSKRYPERFQSQDSGSGTSPNHLTFNEKAGRSVGKGNSTSLKSLQNIIDTDAGVLRAEKPFSVLRKDAAQDKNERDSKLDGATDVNDVNTVSDLAGNYLDETTMGSINGSYNQQMARAGADIQNQIQASQHYLANPDQNMLGRDWQEKNHYCLYKDNTQDPTIQQLQKRIGTDAENDEGVKQACKERPETASGGSSSGIVTKGIVAYCNCFASRYSKFAKGTEGINKEEWYDLVDRAFFGKELAGAGGSSGGSGSGSGDVTNTIKLGAQMFKRYFGSYQITSTSSSSGGAASGGSGSSSSGFLASPLYMRNLYPAQSLAMTADQLINGCSGVTAISCSAGSVVASNLAFSKSGVDPYVSEIGKAGITSTNEEWLNNIASQTRSNAQNSTSGKINGVSSGAYMGCKPAILEMFRQWPPTPENESAFRTLFAEASLGKHLVANDIQSWIDISGQKSEVGKSGFKPNSKLESLTQNFCEYSALAATKKIITRLAFMGEQHLMSNKTLSPEEKGRFLELIDSRRKELAFAEQEYSSRQLAKSMTDYMAMKAARGYVSDGSAAYNALQEKINGDLGTNATLGGAVVNTP